MVGVGIDFVVPNSLDALALYEKIFEVERVEVTNFDQGQNLQYLWRTLSYVG